MIARGLLTAAGLVVIGAAAFAGCNTSEDNSATTFTREQLLDPQTCATCHEDHYKEWSGSMHAYAAEDPVFLALNRRLQRESGGALGDFCVKCHAPMAVRDNLTKDGLNLAELPAKYKGVTCFFCHTADAVESKHNNGLRSGDPTVMRGAFSDAIQNKAHRTAAAASHDGHNLESSAMCGSCHDIVTPGGAHIERTFAEWEQSLFATEKGLTCNSCHMQPYPGLRPIANVDGVFARQGHSHTFAGVDRALTPFPNMDAQKEEIQSLLDSSIQASLCVSVRETSAQLRVILDNVFAGHSFPSGAAADRRAWVELVATTGGTTVYQSGVIEDGKAILNGPADPDLWLLRDVLFDATGKETHLFSDATCYESRILPFPVTANPSDPRFYQRNIVREYPSDGSFIPLPDTVTMRVRMIPVGLDVLDDLIASGDLDPAVRSKMEIMQVGPTITWKPGIGQGFSEPGTGTTYTCVTGTNQDFRANKFPQTITNTCQR